jgi:Tol biopolymer transport system component
VLVEATDNYGVVLKTPLGGVTRLLPDGWGALTVAWEPGGNRLAIGRTAGRGTIWIYDLRTRKAERVTNELGAMELPSLAGVSATGGWIAWWSYQEGGAYIGLDGVPLKVAAAGSHPIRVVPQMLSNRDFVTWCGQRLVLVAGASRTTTYGKSIVVAGPPAWHARSVSRDGTRSWSSPACSPDGRDVVAAAGRNFAEPAFGLEQRSLWVLAADGSSRHRLTSPPTGQSDEAPQWSSDGQFVLFVRVVRIVGISAVGELYLADRQGHIFGPLGTVEGGNYYGHYNFSVDWHV